MEVLGVAFWSKPGPTQAPPPPAVGWHHPDEAIPRTENKCRGGGNSPVFPKVCLNNEPRHLCTRFINIDVSFDSHSSLQLPIFAPDRLIPCVTGVPWALLVSAVLGEGTGKSCLRRVPGSCVCLRGGEGLLVLLTRCSVALLAPGGEAGVVPRGAGRAPSISDSALPTDWQALSHQPRQMW